MDNEDGDDSLANFKPPPKEDLKCLQNKKLTKSGRKLMMMMLNSVSANLIFHQMLKKM